MKKAACIIALIYCFASTVALGADFKGMVTKYIGAAQKKDLATLFNMNAYYQAQVAQIAKESPKFMIQRNVQALFEKEKNALEYNNKLWLYVPSMKWKLLESKHKPKAYDGYYGKIYTVYIEMRFDDVNTAPIHNKKPIKSLIASIDFSADRKQYMGVGNLGLTLIESDISYWQWKFPLRISKFEYAYEGYNLQLSFDVDGGKPDSVGGTPPYQYLVAIEDITESGERNLLSLEEYFDLSKYDVDGTTVTYRAEKEFLPKFKWPPTTKFPVKIAIIITDNSNPQLKEASALIIEQGIIADSDVYERGGKNKKAIKKKNIRSAE